jgi:hypothetical protein
VRSETAGGLAATETVLVGAAPNPDERRYTWIRFAVVLPNTPPPCGAAGDNEWDHISSRNEDEGAVVEERCIHCGIKRIQNAWMGPDTGQMGPARISNPRLPWWLRGRAKVKVSHAMTAPPSASPSSRA